MFVKDLQLNQTFEEFTLILPSISVGNAGQLAVDYLIHYLKATKSHQLWHDGVLPVVGKNPFDENSASLGLPVEVFISAAQKLVLVQIRSPILRKFESDFLSELLDFFQNRKVKQTIILSSLFAQNRNDVQLTDKLERYIACPVTLKNFKADFDRLHWKTLEQFSSVESSLSLSGAGFSQKAFKLCQDKNMPCLILFKFCADGDNIPDAIDLVSFLDSWLGLTSFKDKKSYGCKTPPSWKFLFGIPGPKEIW